MPRITPVPYQQLCRVFELAGFQLARQEGDHRVYIKPGVSRPIVIPCYRAVPVFIILNNLRTAGLSRDDYFAQDQFAAVPRPHRCLRQSA